MLVVCYSRSFPKCHTFYFKDSVGYSGVPHETGKNTPFCSWLTHDYDRPVVCVGGFATSVFRVESMRCAFFFGRCDLVRDHQWSIHKGFRHQHGSGGLVFGMILCWCNGV